MAIIAAYTGTNETAQCIDGAEWGPIAGYFYIPTDYAYIILNSVEVSLAHWLWGGNPYGPEATITCTIRTGINVGGKDQGTILCSDTMSNQNLPTAPNWPPDWSGAAFQTFSFDSQIIYPGGYHVVLDVEESAGETLTKWAGNRSPFDGDEVGIAGGASIWQTTHSEWQAFNTIKRYFRINGIPVFHVTPPPDVPPFPPPRPDPWPDDPYPPDPWWDPPDPPVPPTPPGPLPPYWATGGGRWQKNLVVSGNNKVYYESHAALTVRYTI